MNTQTDVTIYFGEKKIVFAKNAKEVLTRKNITNAIVLYDCTLSNFLTALDEIVITEIEYLVLEGSMQDLFNMICEKYTLMEAGGGVVINPFNSVLLIYRKGKWDLPKGRMDANETIEECAVREVMEETGIDEVVIKGFLDETFHIYSEKNMPILKRTTWYKMYSEASLLMPQKGEGITKVAWTTTEELKKYKKNIYPTIIELLQKAGRKF